MPPSRESSSPPSDSGRQLEYQPASREEIKLLLLLDKTEDRVAELTGHKRAKEQHDDEEQEEELRRKVGFYVKQLADWLDKLGTHPQ